MFIDNPLILKKLEIFNHNLIKEAIYLLEQNKKKFLIIKNSKGYFLGVLNDGDIRRGLIKNFSLNDKVEKIFNRSPFYLNKKINNDQAKILFKKHDIDFIPYIIKKKFSGFYYKKDILLTGDIKIRKHPNHIVVMAGGKGTRLKEFTKNNPKPMLVVNGKPILESIIGNGVLQGFENFIITINYLGSKIKKYFNDGSKFYAKISYVKENKPLGTAGSLFFLKKYIFDDFIVTNGDLVSNIKYEEIIKSHIKNKADFTVGIKLDRWNCSYGVVELKGEKVESIKEKPVINLNLVAGVYVLSPKLLNLIKKPDYLDMTDFIKILIKKNKKIFAFPIYESWQDVGNYKDFLKLKKKLV
jgi:dTDP-glucose pyrophosphorylase